MQVGKQLRLFWSFRATYTVATADTTVVVDFVPPVNSAMRVEKCFASHDDDVAGALSIGNINADGVSIGNFVAITAAATAAGTLRQSTALSATAGSLCDSTCGVLITNPEAFRVVVNTDHLHVGHILQITLTAELFGGTTAPTRSLIYSGTAANITEAVTENTITRVAV